MGRYRIIAEGAVAGVIYTVATGNFLAGYLSSLGASVSLCAAAAMIPSFGCVLQFISPFVFERMHHRKLAIWLMCVVFRLSVSSILLIPLALPDPGHARAVVLVLYTIGFSLRGLLRRGWNTWFWPSPPRRARSVLRRQEHYRNLRFQRGNTCTWSRTGLLSGTGAGLYRLSYHRYCQPVAYCGGCRSACFGKREPGKIHLQNAPGGYSAPSARPCLPSIAFYCIIGGLTGGFASPFLSVYELRVLGLSHTFITSVGVVSAVVGMAGSWVWGRLADRTAWNCVIWLTAFLNLSCTLGWSFVRPSFAHLVAPVLIVVAAGCAGGASLASTNLQFALSPESGKTAYFGVTAAMSSIATCTSAAVGTAIQPMLENLWGTAQFRCCFCGRHRRFCQPDYKWAKIALCNIKGEKDVPIPEPGSFDRRAH